NNFHWVFAIAIVPAFLSVFILIIGVKEPATPVHSAPVHWPLKLTVLEQLPKDYWWVFTFAFVFTLARFSEAFLILRAETLGLTLAYTPLILMWMSCIYAISAYPLGKQSDRLGRIGLLVLSLMLLIIANIVLAAATDVITVFIGVGLWGLHLGASQGILSALIADTAPMQLRATAYGLFSLSSGIATLLASIIAGALWVSLGAGATFIAGAIFTGLALLLLGAYQYVRTL
ncbi:MAG TPA: MFS transporter, partial [Gammaproteobacteria bacterium]|nr:MFS transporter [Gammaproteobacteria bacterium]